jgi:hypothetical protein
MGMMPPSSNAVVVTVNPGLAGGRGVAGACAGVCANPSVAIDNTSAPSSDCFALNKPPSGPILPFLFIPLPQSAIPLGVVKYPALSRPHYNTTTLLSAFFFSPLPLQSCQVKSFKQLYLKDINRKTLYHKLLE